MSPGATFLLKWLVVPIAVAATGYFVVGPRVGGPVAERAAKKIKRSGIAQHIAPITTTQPTAGAGDDVIADPDPDVKPNRQDEPRSTSTAAGPQVSVAVTPANSSGNEPGPTLKSRPADDSAAPPTRKRRHRSAATTTQPAPPREKSADPGPTEDPAGVGAGVP